MGSSGVAVTDRVVFRGCDNCGYDGEVIEVIDPEGPYAGWECPTCKTTHETTEAVFYDGPAPDYARDVARDDLWN
jgi:hypothetical protein